jgi:hypothetical protein
MEDDFNMVAFLCVNPTPAGRSKRLARFFLFFGFVLSHGEQGLLLANNTADLKLTQINDREGDPTTLA